MWNVWPRQGGPPVQLGWRFDVSGSRDITIPHCNGQLGTDNEVCLKAAVFAGS